MLADSGYKLASRCKRVHVALLCYCIRASYVVQYCSSNGAEDVDPRDLSSNTAAPAM
jgi:hypothetical protein